MLQLVVVSVATYFELFLIRGWLWGTLGTERVLAILRMEPMVFLWDEVTFLMASLAVATFSSVVSCQAMRIMPVGEDRVSRMRLLITLLISLIIMLGIAMVVKRVALGT